MLDQSLIKSNFIGRDGFVWWIGQIPPEGNHHGQINGAGWGNRYKVRILGYDSPKPSELKDDDVRWAQVLLPTTAGSGAANQSSSISISPGDIVFGFFLDGNDANVPVILGVFGRTSLVPTNEYTSPFQPYTGYTSKIDNDGSNIVKSESNEQNASSQKSPRSVSLKQAKKIGSDERSSYTAIGDIIKGASASSSSTVSKMSNEIDNFINRVQTITDNVSGAIGNSRELVDAEIAKITAKIQKISSGIVNDMVNNLYEKLAPILNSGLKLLYRTVYAVVLAATRSTTAAHLAGVAAQNAMVLPVKAVQDIMPCVANTVLGSIAETISGLLTSISENVFNFVSCISDQFIGGLMNHIIGGIDSILTPVLGGIDKILMGFNVVSFLRSSAEGLISGNMKLSCSEIAPNYNSPTNQWVVGKGAKEEPGVPIQTILESANLASSIAESFISSGEAISDFVRNVGSLDFLGSGFSNPGFQGLVSDCYGGPPLNCGGVKVKMFGSNGSGASAKAIIGSIVGNGASATGSIVGFDLLSGGSGYDFPPFIEIVDDCNQGYGAVARTVIDYNKNSPTYGQVVDVYIVSEGENYPIGDPEESEQSYTIEDVTIIEPGIGYTNNDMVIDLNNPTVQYKIEVGTTNGEIFKVFPINNQLNNVQEVTDLPILKVKSQTGYGATLKARLKPRPKYQGEIKQQIDCISK